MKYRIMCFLLCRRPMISLVIEANNPLDALSRYRAVLIKEGFPEDLLDRSDWYVSYHKEEE